MFQTNNVNSHVYVLALSILLLFLRFYYSGICLIRHTKGPGKWVGLYRMSEPV